MSALTVGCGGGGGGGGAAGVAPPANGGALDPAFDGDGQVVIDATAGMDFARDTVVQPDGKIVVVGGNDGNSGAVVARMNADGSPDTGFAGGGLALLDAPGGEQDTFNAVILQPDGKILIAGEFQPSNDGNRRGLVARLNADGSLDTTFGGDGFADADFGAGLNFDGPANDLVLQSNGQIVVVGGLLTDGVQLPAALRLEADGTLDASYGPSGNGKSTFGINIGGSRPIAAAALQSDGKLVATGQDIDGNDFFVGRLDIDGLSDGTFGSGGVQTIDIAGSVDTDPTGIAVQADGMIVVGGSLLDSPNGLPDFAVARLDQAGMLDAGFDTDGVVFQTFGGTDLASDLAIDGDGKIVLAGDAFSDFALARWNTDGSLDSTFNKNGTPGLRRDDLGGVEQGFGLALQADNQIVVAGRTDADVAVIRVQ